jgi:hypothetical protein
VSCKLVLPDNLWVRNSQPVEEQGVTNKLFPSVNFPSFLLSGMLRDIFSEFQSMTKGVR